MTVEGENEAAVSQGTASVATSPPEREEAGRTLTGAFSGDHGPATAWLSTSGLQTERDSIPVVLELCGPLSESPCRSHTLRCTAFSLGLA